VKQIRKRLTYANVMSSIAVFLVLGGATALAAGLAKNSVGSKQLKKNAVTSAKIKNNAVTTSKIKNGAITGAKVNAGTLGTVPNAAHAGSADTANSANTAKSADTANSAGNANAVNGQQVFKLNYRADEGSGPSTFFNSHGLTITGACGSGEEISVIATTSKDGSSIYSFVGTDLDPENPAEDDLEGGGFDSGEDFDLLAGTNGNISFVHFEFDALDGTIATGTLAVDEGGEDDDCLATGNLIIG
jgi:hypothetical protein